MVTAVAEQIAHRLRARPGPVEEERAAFRIELQRCWRARRCNVPPLRFSTSSVMVTKSTVAAQAAARDEPCQVRRPGRHAVWASRRLELRAVGRSVGRRSACASARRAPASGSGGPGSASVGCGTRVSRRHARRNDDRGPRRRIEIGVRVGRRRSGCGRRYARGRSAARAWSRGRPDRASASVGRARRSDRGAACGSAAVGRPGVGRGARVGGRRGGSGVCGCVRRRVSSAAGSVGIADRHAVAVDDAGRLAVPSELGQYLDREVEVAVAVEAAPPGEVVRSCREAARGPGAGSSGGRRWPCRWRRPVSSDGVTLLTGSRADGWRRRPSSCARPAAWSTIQHAAELRCRRAPARTRRGEQHGDGTRVGAPVGLLSPSPPIPWSPSPDPARSDAASRDIPATYRLTRSDAAPTPAVPIAASTCRSLVFL